MTADERSDRTGKRHRADDLGADLRVHLHLLPLVRRQRAGFGQDVLGHREFPDVMQQRRDLDRLSIELRQLEPARQCRRVILDPLDMTTAALVLRLNRPCEHLRALAVQMRPLRHAPLLLRNPSEVDAIGSIGQAQRNEGERRLPLSRPLEHLDGDAGSDRSDDVAVDASTESCRARGGTRRDRCDRAKAAATARELTRK